MGYVTVCQYYPFNTSITTQTEIELDGWQLSGRIATHQSNTQWPSLRRQCLV